MRVAPLLSPTLAFASEQAQSSVFDSFLLSLFIYEYSLQLAVSFVDPTYSYFPKLAISFVDYL